MGVCPQSPRPHIWAYVIFSKHREIDFLDFILSNNFLGEKFFWGLRKFWKKIQNFRFSFFDVEWSEKWWNMLSRNIFAGSASKSTPLDIGILAIFQNFSKHREIVFPGKFFAKKFLGDFFLWDLEKFRVKNRNFWFSYFWCRMIIKKVETCSPKYLCEKTKNE